MPNSIDELIKLFEQSLDDGVVSRSERKSLRRTILANPISDHEQKVLLNEIKNLALSKSDSPETNGLIEWMYESFKILNSVEQDSENSTAYFSPGTGCRKAICSRIRFARENIRICVFTISDDLITSEILEAHRMGKNVRIITDNDKAFDMGSDIYKLEKMGIDIVKDRTDDHMHHKFALFDNDILLTGSYNWTRSAAKSNYENLLVTSEASVFRDYEAEFERLWKKFS